MALSLLEGDAGGDAALDPNLALMQQQQTATSPDATIPPPPPLSTTTSTSPTTTTSTTSPTSSIDPNTTTAQTSATPTDSGTTTADAPPPPPALDPSSTPTAPTAPTSSSSDGLSYDASGGVVNNTGQYITKDGINYPPGYGTAEWFSHTGEEMDQNDPNAPGSTAWAWQQNHGADAQKLADMQTWTRNPDGSYTDKSGNQWTAQMYNGVLDTLKLGSSGYSPELANDWNNKTADIWDKYGMTAWAGVSRGDPAAIAAWQKASADAAAKQAAGDGSPNRYLQGGLEQYADGTAVQGGYNALTDLYRQLGTTPGTVNPQVLQLVQQNPALINTLPAAQQATLRATLTSMGIKLPSTGATGTPTSGFGGSTLPGGSYGSGAPAPGAPGAIGSQVLPTGDPRLDALRKLVDSTSGSLAGVDRTKLALDMWNQFQEGTDPAYQASLRDAQRHAFGAGRGVSGQMRTQMGDLAAQRAQALDLAKRGLMSDALNGSIEDQFRKFGALSGLEGQVYGEGAGDRNELRTERGYQGSLEQQAFERALQQYELQQQAQQQQFQNGIALAGLSGASNLEDYYAQLAKQYNMDPATIAKLAESMFSGSGTKSPTTSSSLPLTPTAPTSTTPFVPSGYIDDYGASGQVYS